MTDTNTFLNDLIEGDTGPGNDVGNFLDGIIADLPDDKDPTGFQEENKRREIDAFTDQALAAEPPVAPALKLPSAAIPKSIGEAITNAGKEGVTLEFSPGLWDDMEKQAQLQALNFIKQTGGKLKHVDSGAFDNLVGGIRDTLVRMQSEASDEEKDTILTDAGGLLSALALNRGITRLNELQQKGEDASPQEVKLIQDAAARMQSFGSLLQQGDTAAVNTLRVVLSDALKKRDRDDLNSSLTLRQLGGFLSENNPHLTVDEIEGTEAHGARLLPWQHAQRLRGDLSRLLEGDPSEPLRHAINGATARVKLGALGLAPEQIDEQGIMGAVNRRFPGILEGVAVQAITPELVEGSVSAEHMERVRTELTMGGRMNDVLTAARTPVEELGETSDLSGAFAHIFGAATQFSGDVLAGVAEGFDRVARDQGWKLEPWQQKQADLQSIKLGVKSGDVDIGAMMRYTGVGSMGWGIGYYLENLGDEVTSVADFVKWSATGEGRPSEDEKIGLGKLIAEELKDVPSGQLTPTLAREILKEATNELAVEALELKDSEEQLKRYHTDAAKELKENGVSFSSMYKTAKAALFEVGYVDFKRSFHLAVSEPDALPVLGAVSFIAGKAGTSVLRGSVSAADKIASRMTLTHRLRKHIRDVAFFEPEALQAFQKAAKSSGVKGISEHRLATLTDIAEQLAEEATTTVRDASRLTQKTADRFWRDRAKTTRAFDKHLKGLRADSLESVLDRMQVPKDMVQDTLQPARVGFLAEVASATTNKLKIGGFTKRASAGLRTPRNLAGEITDAINRGATTEEIQGMAAPLVGNGEGYRWWGRQIMDTVVDQFPALQRAFGRSLDYETASITSRIAKFARDELPVIVALRDHNMLVRGRQLDILSLAQRRTRSTLDVLRRKSPETMTPDNLKEIERLSSNGRKLEFARNEIDARAWDQDVKLSNNDALLDTLSFADMHTWHKAAEGLGGDYDLFDKLAKRDGLGTIVEHPSVFRKRLADLERVEHGILEGTITGSEKKQALKKIKEIKKQFARQLYDREVPRKFLDFEADADHSFNQAWVNKVERRRAKLEKAGDTEALAKLPKVVKREIRGDLQEMKSLHDTLEVGHQNNVYDRYGGWDYGRPGDVIDQVRHIHQDRKGVMAGEALTTKRFMEELDKASPADRKAFDDMLFEAARGNYKSWDDYLDANPHMRERFFEGSENENLGRAFMTMDSMRQDKLNRMFLHGQINKAQFDELVKPYAPQLYSADEFPALVGSVTQSRLKKRGGGTFDPTKRGTERESDLFQVQRDMYQTRLLVKQDGSNYVNKLFDDEKQAKAWLKDRIGIADEAPFDGIGIAGRTGFGDEYKILKPLGEEHAAKLGILGRGEALGKRIAELERESLFYDLTQTINRPGWVVDETTYLKAQQTAQGQRLYRNFYHVKAPNSPLFGSLNGKYVSKRGINILQQMAESVDFVDSVKRELLEVGLSDVPGWGKPAAGIFKRVGDLGRTIKSMISTQLIARSPPTHITNRLSDSQQFANTADGRYLKDKIGHDAYRTSRDFLLGFDKAPNNRFTAMNAGKSLSQELAKIKAADPETGQLIQEGIEDGMIGDSMVGNPIEGDLKAQLTKNWWGPTETRLSGALQPKTKATNLKLQGRLKEVSDELERWAAGDSDLNIQTVSRLQSEKAALEETVGVNPDVLADSGRRAIESVRWIAGTKGKFGTFDELSNWSSQLYAREGNIHRLGVYLSLRARGHSREYAKSRVRKYMQDYSNIPGFVKILRNTPIANPMVSYPAEWLRTQMNVLKEQPGFILGAMAAAPSISSVALMVSGKDPVEYWMAKNGGNPIDAMVDAVGRLEVINPFDTRSTISAEVSTLNPLQMLQKPTGFMADVVDSIEKDAPPENNPFSFLASLGTRVASKAVGSNPIIDGIYTTGTNKDAFTRRPLGGGVQTNITHVLKQVGRIATPGAMPWLGGPSQRFIDNLQKPPNMNTARVVSASESALQNFLGVKLRGALPIVDDLAESQTGARPFDYGAKILIQAMGLGRDVEIPKVLPRTRPYSDLDLATTIFYSNRKFAVRGAPAGDFAHDGVQDDLRTGAFWVAHGKRTNDPKVVGWGERIRSRARDDLAEQLKARAAFAEIPDLAGAQVEREIIARTRKASESLDLGNSFSKADLVHQARSLIGMSRLGLDEEIINNMTMRAVYVNQQTFDNTNWTNPNAIKVASEHIRLYLESLDDGATGTNALRFLHGEILNALPRAIEWETRNRFKDDLNFEAARLWMNREDSK